uniref:Enoyl reductase (ER) domain-containing protein n=1 Tax=Salarias fasciatus TaxID=181472 RepID=A0A672HZ22_SALFA
MKGLYCRAGPAEPEPRFVIQETVLPDVLENHEVRVKVRACGLSPLDLQLLGDVGINTDLVPVGRDVAGVVLQVGPQVTFFQPQDEVVGILPLDSALSGLCDVVHIDEFLLVHRPDRLSAASAAAALRDGLRAYSALHTLGGMATKQTLLVTDGGSPAGLMCVQLAVHHGLKVLTTAHSAEDRDFLETLRPAVGQCSCPPPSPLSVLLPPSLSLSLSLSLCFH